MKKVNKDNGDCYYRLAKSCSFRARSVYKLMHIDQKYNIFENVERVMDLCSAPGSWSLFLSQKVPRPALIVSVDLQDMLPIEGVTKITGDITSSETLKKVEEYLQGSKLDGIVCDGAPDVTGIHDLDEYSSTQLLLAVVKIAIVVLKDNGFLAIKMFKGRNKQTLKYVLGSFFRDVDAFKPPSSRKQSAEFFFVCRRFCRPRHYDQTMSFEDYLQSLYYMKM